MKMMISSSSSSSGGRSLGDGGHHGGGARMRVGEVAARAQRGICRRQRRCERRDTRQGAVRAGAAVGLRAWRAAALPGLEGPAEEFDGYSHHFCFLMMAIAIILPSN